MAQTKDGAAKIAAQKIGISLSEYLLKLESGEKWCYSCKKWKPVSNFGKDKSRGDGRKAKCFECCTTKLGGPTAQARKQMHEKGFEWCRVCQGWISKENIKSGLCKICKAAYERERYASDINYMRDRKERAHARKRGIKPIPHTGQEILLEDFEGRCAYCLSAANSWDHIVPVSKGGQSTPGNVVPCCISCNSRKKNMDFNDWIGKCKSIHPALEDRLVLADCGLWG